MFRVISTDTLEFLMMLDCGGDVQTCRSNRKTLTAGVAIPGGGLAEALNARRFRSWKLLTVSMSGGAVFTSPGSEGRESLLIVDTDGTGGFRWQGCYQLSIDYLKRGITVAGSGCDSFVE